MRISPVTFFSQLKNQNSQNQRTAVFKGDPDGYVPDSELSDIDFNLRYSINYCDAGMAYAQQQREKSEYDRYQRLVPCS